MPHRLAAILASAVIGVAVVAGCGGGDDDGPSSADVPSGAVAVVGDAEISGDQLDEQVEAVRRAQSNGADGKGGDSVAKAQRKQLEAQALSMILMREALEQEAAERGIEVSDAEVRQRWQAAAKQQFKTKKALRRFLGGQRLADILAQLRLQVLTERIHAQIAKEDGGGKDGAKAVEEFQAEFQERWQGRTRCRDGYSAPGCD